MSWRANSLHCVIFSPFQPGAADALQPWLRIFQTNPQSYQQTPTPGGSQAHASGPYGVYTTSLVMQPGRLELILHPGISTTPSMATLPPAIQEISPALVILRRLADKMVGPDSPHPIRAALVLNLLKPMSDVGAAGSDFMTNTRLANLPACVTESWFSLNVPQPIEGLGVAMNRTCRWGVSSVQLMQFQVGPGVGLVPPSSPAQPVHLSTLQIDLNTEFRSTPFNPQDTTRALTALFDEANVILAQGYDRFDIE